MECGTCIEALSARLDGETEPVPATEADEHLRGCADCQAWHVGAVALTRRLRVRAATATPDLVAAVLAEAAPRRRPVARIALATVGLVQLLLAVAQLFGTHVHGENLTSHVMNEGAAWNLALGLAMLAAAWQTKRAAGLLPAVGGFAAALLVLSVVDLATIGVPASRLLSHIPLLLGLALLYRIHRRHKQDRGPAPTARDTDDSQDYAIESGADERPAAPPRPWLRPAGHHRAA
jgi:predicted anti-sigma-YlaC factor YlaD